MDGKMEKGVKIYRLYNDEHRSYQCPQAFYANIESRIPKIEYQMGSFDLKGCDFPDMVSAIKYLRLVLSTFYSRMQNKLEESQMQNRSKKLAQELQRVSNRSDEPLRKMQAQDRDRRKIDKMHRMMTKWDPSIYHCQVVARRLKMLNSCHHVCVCVCVCMKLTTNIFYLFLFCFVESNRSNGKIRKCSTRTRRFASNASKRPKFSKYV